MSHRQDQGFTSQRLSSSSYSSCDAYEFQLGSLYLTKQFRQHPQQQQPQDDPSHPEKDERFQFIDPAAQASRRDFSSPQFYSMKNFTPTGFYHTKISAELQQHMIAFWNQTQDFKTLEYWSSTNTFLNWKESPSYMLDIQGEVNDKDGEEGEGLHLSQMIQESTQNVLEEWTHQKLHFLRLYGIRIFTKGAVVLPHLDSEPFVVSAILHVAHDSEQAENWPLQIHTHDGQVYNITMQSGDILLYESQWIRLGYPSPLEGNFYANMYLHFEPTDGYAQERLQEMYSPPRIHPTVSTNGQEMANLESLYQKVYQQAKEAKASISARSKEQQKKRRDPSKYETTLPYYIRSGSEEAKRWKQQVQYAVFEFEEAEATIEDLANNEVTAAHLAAIHGKLNALKRLAAVDPTCLTAMDVNGWQPIHEAARAGYLDIVEYLIEQGVDINIRTNFGTGGTALYWANDALGKNHPVTRLLEHHGAKNIPPDPENVDTNVQVLHSIDFVIEEDEDEDEDDTFDAEANEF